MIRGRRILVAGKSLKVTVERDTRVRRLVALEEGRAFQKWACYCPGYMGQGQTLADAFEALESNIAETEKL